MNAWSAHSDLGRIVTEISTEFVRNPPRIGGPSSMRPDPPVPAYQMPPGQQHYQNPPPPAAAAGNTMSRRRQSSERRQTQTPSIPAVFPELEEFSYVVHLEE